MPIYEWKCLDCSEISEIIQKLDDPDPICSKCKSKGKRGSMKKCLSRNGSFILKGSGWFRDGYSRK